MTTTIARRYVRNSPLLAALAALVFVVNVAEAQTAAEAPNLFVVIADDVHVRSGAADSYYPFGLLSAGDVVAVTGEKFKWARVATYGPAFREFYGFIKYPKTETSRFHLSPDGKTGLTLGRVDILAPNLNTNFNPKDSWKPVARLDADQQVVVLETLETGREVVQRVALPQTAVGWISTTALTPATPSQVAAWDAAMAESTAKAEALKLQETGDRVLARAEPTVKPVDLDPAPPTDVPTTTPTTTATTTATTTTTTTTGDALSTVTMKPAATATDATATAQAKPAKRQIDPELAALEREYEELSGAEQTASVPEIRALQLKYTELATRKGDVRRTALFAKTRAKQLKIWADLQERRAELGELRTRVGLSATDTDDAVVAIDANSRYIVMGRLAVSRVYDGSKLPKLFRLQEPGTGRTVAYLRPAKEVDLVPMLGQLIGIVGEKSYDPGLRLTLVTPRRIDLLAPQN